jgi:hypothetical protein
MNTTELHLWEMETSWFDKPKSEMMNGTYPYKSWKDFQDCKPYKLWKPYILSSWSWKQFNLEETFHKTTKRHEPERHTMSLYPPQHNMTPETIQVSPPGKQVDMLQIVLISPERFVGLCRVEIVVEKQDEPAVRDWIQRHMPKFWKL